MAPPERAAILAELDRLITKSVRTLGRTRRPDRAGLLAVAAEVQQLEAARETFARFGHRARGFSKGVAVD